ncbi:MAG: hypothetical protein ACHQU8_07260 [Gemmatimonadales bacterium]
MRELKPPTRAVKIMCYLIGAAVFTPTLYQHFGKIGLAVGLGLGVLLGRILGRWVEHTFLEF